MNSVTSPAVKPADAAFVGSRPWPGTLSAPRGGTPSAAQPAGDALPVEVHGGQVVQGPCEDFRGQVAAVAVVPVGEDPGQALEHRRGHPDHRQGPLPTGLPGAADQLPPHLVADLERGPGFQQHPAHLGPAKARQRGRNSSGMDQ